MQAVPHREHAGVSIIPLYYDANEQVEVHEWEADASINMYVTHGLELLVLEGEFIENQDHLHKHSWLRLPAGSTLNAKVGSTGTRVWIKRNHLQNVNAQIKRVLTITTKP